MRRFRLRPHHALCIQFFEGKGYSDQFTANMISIINLLKENPAVEIVYGADSLCEKCPNLTGNGCQYAMKVNAYDRMVAELCGFQSGDIMTASEFFCKAKKIIIESGKMKAICGDCSWSGICFRKR